MRKFVISCLLLNSLLLANDRSIEELMSMSLEELMNIEITTATGEKETTSESISIVSVITSSQLKQMGVLNLYEATRLIAFGVYPIRAG